MNSLINDVNSRNHGVDWSIHTADYLINGVDFLLDTDRRKNTTKNPSVSLWKPRDLISSQ